MSDDRDEYEFLMQASTVSQDAHRLTISVMIYDKVKENVHDWQFSVINLMKCDVFFVFFLIDLSYLFFLFLFKLN